MASERDAINEYRQKHGTCDIQQHPWPAVFGAGFEAGLNASRAATARPAPPATDARDAEIERAERLASAGGTVSAYVYAKENPGSIPIHVRMAMKVFEDDQSEKARAKRAALASEPAATESRTSGDDDAAAR